MFNTFFSKENGYLLLANCMSGIFAALLTTAMLNHHFQKIATVNITGIVSSFMKETAQQNISKVEMEHKTEIFGKLLKKYIDEVSIKTHSTILISESVLAGSADYTQEVSENIRAGLRK